MKNLRLESKEESEFEILLNSIIDAQVELKKIDLKHPLLACSIYHFGDTPVTNLFFHEKYAGMNTREALETHYENVQGAIYQSKFKEDALQVA